MSTIVGEQSVEGTRRRLTSHQAELVQRLVDASVEEVMDRTYEGMTIRNVAKRAGVAPATAYTYFGSKDHLIAEVLWRRIRALPPVSFGESMTTTQRIEAALEDLGLFTTDDPVLSSAFTTAMLGNGPDVKHLRIRIGLEIHNRFVAALGSDVDESVLSALELAYSGAMLQAGMGHISYDEVPARLAEVAALVIKGAA